MFSPPVVLGNEVDLVINSRVQEFIAQYQVLRQVPDLVKIPCLVSNFKE